MATLHTYDMNKIMILATVAILAASITFATTGPTMMTPATAQMADNATMGNMTGGNMTGGNMTMGGNSTDVTGGISGIGDDPFT